MQLTHGNAVHMLYGVNLATSYLLMLAAMTFNVGIFAGTCTGALHQELLRVSGSGPVITGIPRGNGNWSVTLGCFCFSTATQMIHGVHTAHVFSMVCRVL